MTTETITPTKKRKTGKVVLIILGSIFALCVICSISAAIYGNTPEGKAASAERYQQQTLAAMVKTLSPTQANAIPAVAKEVPTVIPAPLEIPTPTQVPLLGMDMNQFVAQYDARTDIQKKEFVGQSIGKWVVWSGQIYDVSNNGTVTVRIPETLLSTVYLRGIPTNIGITLQKGATINYQGRIADINNFLGLNIYVDNAQLIQ